MTGLQYHNNHVKQGVILDMTCGICANDPEGQFPCVDGLGQHDIDCPEWIDCPVWAAFLSSVPR